MELPLGEAETRFARAFPGAIGHFACGNSEVILRRTTKATRMMHPAGDCLRAAGFEVRSQAQLRDAERRFLLRPSDHC